MAQSVFGGVQEEDAQARQARAAAAAESRKERDAGRRKALARKVPVTAIMSQQQRCRVEQVLAQLRDAQQVSSNRNSAGECFLQLPTSNVHCLEYTVGLTQEQHCATSKHHNCLLAL